MTLTELRYFVVLAKKLNFIRAASELHISQPTLSLAIKKLEDHCSGLLFERSKTELKLTDLGLKFLNQAQVVLQGVIQLEEIIKQNQDPYNSPLRLGAIHTVGPYLFPLLLPKVKDELGIIVYIYEDFTTKLVQKLLDGELDAIIISDGDSLAQTISFDLYQEDFYLACSLKHQLANQEYIKFSQISGDNLLVLGEGNCFRDQVLTSCPTQLLTGSEQIIASSLETIRQMVNLQLGVSIFPYLATLNHAPPLSYIKLIEPAVSRRLVLVTRKTTNKYKLLKQVSSLINKLIVSV